MQACTAGSVAWIMLSSKGAQAHGESQKQHAGDTLWSSKIPVCSCLLPRLNYSSMIQSLGNPLAAFGKAVPKHGNTSTECNN